ncbi:MAG: ComF family protein [Treponema sp.]|nr:ComF family protein [Treponema sp.]
MIFKKKFFLIKNKIKSFFRKLTSVFISPFECIGCSEQCYEISLCKKCQNHLEQITPLEKRCKICGKELISELDICMQCRREDEKIIKHLDNVFPLYEYQLWKKELLFQWKISENRGLSQFFAKNICAVYEKYFFDFALVPVPPRPGKIKKKGWDQILELCEYLENIYNVKIYNILKRINVEQQKKLNKTERLSHIEKSYILKKNVIDIPEKIVLLDDIMTTGATLESCAKLLKAKGAKKICALTLFTKN